METMRTRVLIVLLCVASTACVMRGALPAASVQPAAAGLAEEERTLLADALNQFTDRWKDTISVCLTISGGDGQVIPVDEMLTGMLHQRHTIVTGPVCESHSTGMRVVVGATGANKAATAEQLRVHRLDARRPVLIDSSHAVIHLTVVSGTDYDYDCLVSRMAKASVICELKSVTNY